MVVNVFPLDSVVSLPPPLKPGIAGNVTLETPDRSSTDDAESWIRYDLRSRVMSFQDKYVGEVALVFWFPATKAPFTPWTRTFTQ